MTADDSTSFGAVLRRFRAVSGLTQEELAERAGLSRRGINDLERGARLLPRKDTVALLADALGLVGAERTTFLGAARRPSAFAVPAVTSVPDGPGSLDAPTSALPAGTITFLFTDIEGSTRLLQQLGSEYAQVLGEHQAILRAAFAANDGVEVDTQGDAFFVAFPTAPQAVTAAAAGTLALAAHAWPEGTTVRVRMGLHTGTPQVVGDHYVGLDVHRAARIAAAGHGGQVLLSQATSALTEQALPEGMTLRDLGAHQLKDLQHPERIFQLVLAGLPADFPLLKTLDTHQHNLPVQPTSLLGRQEQVAALTGLLRRDDVRLVTVTGAGGIGKTRLAIQVAAELIEAFPDGVWFVRLSRLVDPELVVPTIARVLGVQEPGSQPVAEALRAHLARKHLLLVLDNFEQVVGAASEVAKLLAASPGLHFLITSRVPVHLRGEREYPLAPLPLPDPHHLPAPEALTQYAAVALFIERARGARPDFVVTTSNGPAIAEICQRLDGLPLAIELAAARVKILPPEALLARLATQLQVLTGGSRDLEERQQTMRATIAWSEALLMPGVKVLFRRLAVFVGGCTFEDAEVVSATPEGAAPLDLDLLEGLTELVEQSLVQQREEEGEPRFVLLRVIREYALERLESSGEAESLCRAHAAQMLALADQANQQRTGPESVAWRDRVEREHDNLRAALAWARDSGEAELGLRLAEMLFWFWRRRGHVREARRWLEEFLAAGPVDALAMDSELAKLRAQALVNCGTLALLQGAYPTAVTEIEQGRALALAVGDQRTARIALTNLGRVASAQGDLERAAARYAESLALAREIGDKNAIATLLTNLANVDNNQGNLELATERNTESLALARELGDHDLVALCLNNLGVLARRRGDLSQSEAYLRQALVGVWKLGDPHGSATVLESLAETAVAAGRPERAARLLGAATAVRETVGAPLTAYYQAKEEEEMAPARAALGEEQWAAAFASGRALSLEQAIAEALGPSAT